MYERGAVESAVVSSRVPATAAASFDSAALEAIRLVRFHPSVRDGKVIRSRVEYVVVFHAPASSHVPAPPASTSMPPPASTSPPASATPPGSATSPALAPPPLAPVDSDEQDEDYALTI